MSGETEAKTSKLLTSLLTYIETSDKVMEKHEALFCCWAGGRGLGGGNYLLLIYLSVFVGMIWIHLIPFRVTQSKYKVVFSFFLSD